MSKLTHTSKSIAGQLDLYEDRAKNLYLKWCAQVFNLVDLNNDLSETNILKINDIGCNYFQFYKEIKRKKSDIFFNYFGYDIDQDFINLGLKYFPELKDNFKVCNIEDIQPRKADISIISATLEHAENPYKLIKNVLMSTSHEVILRTFLGADEIIELIQGEIKGEVVISPYYVNQFSLFEMSNLFLENDFIPTLHADKATNQSMQYDVSGSGVYRRMYILVGKKN